jgi:diacylglycerol O-acyltransferase / wax synthase
MTNTDRLTGLDSAFLHLENHSTAHMHVASVMIFDGQAPTADELVAQIQSRLHLVPRYRQRLAYVPLGQGRPVWVDDPHFNPHYHIRHTALPRPGDEAALKRLAGRLFSQRLDRSKPLWEMWLVDRMAGGRFALVAKTHHALVDGISGVDITTVLFDVEQNPAAPTKAPAPWSARPLPGSAKLLGEALLERTTAPAEIARGIRRIVRAPRHAAEQLKDGLVSLGATTFAGINAPAPPSPLNVEIGPHRRYTWVNADLKVFKAVKDELGGTLNDVVLTAVSLALGRWLRANGHPTEGLVLKAMVPVSVRSNSDREGRSPGRSPERAAALGNRVAAMWAPLPVGVEDPKEAYGQISEAMAELKRSGQAVGAQVLTNLAGFAPPTILSQAARLQARQRYFNLVVTNVPGPQFPLYLLGRELKALYPVVPLASRQALGIAVMSYNGWLGFGLLADYDALEDVDTIAGDLEHAVQQLARAAGTGKRPARAAGAAKAKAPAGPARTKSNGRPAKTGTRTRARPAGGANPAK